MKQRKKVEWSRLDNASKIFPAICNERDTKVFRLTCELNEAVDPEILQQALDITIESFPLYKSVLRRGVFWYYFEISDIKPAVQAEALPVCAPIYNKDIRNLLFRVFYYNKRINIEIFHALSDGTGALWFLQTLVYHYLVTKHKESFRDIQPVLKYNPSISEKMADSFGRYFGGKDVQKPKTKEKKTGSSQAFRIKGIRLDENRMNVIEGSMPAKAVLSEAHRYNTTLTIFIASLFIYSFHTVMNARDKKFPVVLSVPINLRHFFKSETARNFFSTMNAGFQFDDHAPELEEIIKKVSEDFKQSLTEEHLNLQSNKFMSLEKNPFTRVVPLPLKDYSLRLANYVKDRGITASVSNLGQISMPAEFDPYIRQISVLTSARRPQICMCTYKDRLVIGFTSPFRDTEIQRAFFESLSMRGMEIEISSNLQNGRES